MPAILWAQAAGTPISQEEFDRELENWDRTAQQAEELLDSEHAPDAQLENFRVALNANREAASNYVSITQPEVSDLQSQLDALNPTAVSSDDDAPKEAEAPESDELKARKEEVEKSLSQLQGNVLAANQVIKEANGLIDQINARLRQNYYNALLTRSQSPLNPVSISFGAYTLAEIYRSAGDEISGNYQALKGTDVNSEKWPTAIICIIAGMVILIWAPNLVYFQKRYKDEWGTRIQRLMMPLAPLFVSVIALPTAVRLIVFGLEFTQIFTGDALILLHCIQIWCNFLFAATWLRWSLDISENYTRAQASSFGVALYTLAIISGMDWTLSELTRIADTDPESSTTLNFVLIFIGLICVWSLTTKRRYSMLFGMSSPKQYPAIKELIRRTIRYGMVLALILSIIGYFAASYQMFRGIVITAFVIFAGIHIYLTLTRWIVKLLTEFKDEKYISDDDRKASERLWPVLIQIVIWVSAIPIVLLAWGIPKSTLIEIWSRARSGFTIGEFHISLSNILQMLITFYIGVLIIRALKKGLEKSLLPRTKLDIGARTAIVSLAGYVGYFILVVITLSSAGVDLSALGYIAGALSVGIGFGLQNIVQNFMSGLILLIERPVKKGDWIKVGNSEGYVQNIAVRSTAIRTFDDSTIIIPNADLITHPVVNWHHDDESARVRMLVNVDYKADPDYVSQVLLEVIHENTYKRRDPDASVVIRRMDDSAVVYELRFWINNADHLTRARSEAFMAVLRRFKKEGISIPFPQRDLHIISEPSKS